MKRFITHHDIANQVRMTRSAYSGTFVIVEGDSDARVYKKFVDRDHCRVIPAHGKSNVLNAMEQLETDTRGGVLAIVDSDFWRLDGVAPDNANILVTDTHDLETMIIASAAFDAVMEEFAAPRKLNRLGDARENVLRASLPIGYIRWISGSSQDNLSLRFKDVSFFAVIDHADGSMKTNIDSLMAEVKRHSSGLKVDEPFIRRKLSELIRSREHDPWQVCRGHDMVHILSIGLREVFGNRHARSIGYEQVDRLLRLSFGYGEFAKTRLFKDIESWEKRNKGRHVLERLA